MKNVTLSDHDFSLMNMDKCFLHRFWGILQGHREMFKLFSKSELMIHLEFDKYKIDICIIFKERIIYRAFIWKSPKIWKQCDMFALPQTFNTFVNDLTYIVYEEIIRGNRLGKFIRGKYRFD